MSKRLNKSVKHNNVLRVYLGSVGARSALPAYPPSCSDEIIESI